MISTHTYNKEIIDFLAQIGVSAKSTDGSVWVSRDDMCHISNIPDKIPEEKGGHYDVVLDALKAQFPNLKLFWFGKTDDYLFLDAMIPY